MSYEPVASGVDANKIQGRQVSGENPIDGDDLKWNGSLAHWEPQADAASGGGTWGSITGTLSGQSDLQTALDAKQASLGYTAENSANKDTDGTLAANSDTKYPSQKAVKTYAAGYVPTSTTVNGHALSSNVTVTPTDLSLVIGTNVQAYDADLTTWAGVTPGTGVGTALGVNVGSAGALVTNGGALGTPSSGIATNLTSIPAANLLIGSQATGDILYASSASAWARLANVATGNALISGGVTTAPSWSKITTSHTTGIAASGANTDITSVLLNQTGLVVKGASTNGLTIKPNESLSAGRTLNLVTGNADRTITLSGNPTLGNWFDQSVRTSDSVTFGSVAATQLTAVMGDDAVYFSIALGAYPYITNSNNPGALTLDMGSVAHTLALGTTANTITFPNAASGTVPFLNLAQTFSALQTFSGGATIDGSTLTLSGNQSAAAWTTNGIRIKGISGTLTDTTSSGTVAAAYTNKLGGNTIAASSATTFTNYMSGYFNEPVAGTNVTLTNKWGLGADSLYVGTSNPLTVSNSGVLTATSPVFVTPTLGTPASGTLTNATGLPVAGITASTSTALGVGSLELGHASDTTLSRSSAGVLAVEGVVVDTISATNTLTNKRFTNRVLALSAGSGTPSINTDLYDVVHITAQSAAITSFTTNLTGTPVDGDSLRISITDNGTARALTWGTSFEASTVALPTTTTVSARLEVGLFWNTETTKWRVVATS